MPPSREIVTGTRDHDVVYRLQCVKCNHVWEDSTGWLPRTCPSCGNVIEHGDHLPLHLRILTVRIGRTRE